MWCKCPVQVSRSPAVRCQTAWPCIRYSPGVLADLVGSTETVLFTGLCCACSRCMEIKSVLTDWRLFLGHSDPVCIIWVNLLIVLKFVFHVAKSMDWLVLAFSFFFPFFPSLFSPKTRFSLPKVSFYIINSTRKLANGQFSHREFETTRTPPTPSPSIKSQQSSAEFYTSSASP